MSDVTTCGRFLERRLAFAIGEGIPEDRICLDPGFGFGKTGNRNLALVAGLATMTSRYGRPVVVGLSRKRFLAGCWATTDHYQPLASSVSMAVMAFERGASVFRVHDVREHVQALRQLLHALEQAA